jgi:[histone H3]-trimethyl-L-lysine4 demethylase
MSAIKVWIIIPESSKEKFFNAVYAQLKNLKKQCLAFLWHKNLIFSPVWLENNGIAYKRIIQRPGELIVTFCGAFHQGINLGVNHGEAVNFVSPTWIPYAKASVKYNLNAVSARTECCGR